MRKGNFKTHVTPKGWDVNRGIPPTAGWRLGCGEERLSLKHDRAQKQQPFKGAKEMMKLSLACAQRSVAAWKRKH